MLLYLIGCFLAVMTGCGQGGKGPQGPPQGAVEVVVGKPLVTPIVEWDAYTGRLEAIESVEVLSRVSGYLNSHHFDEGQIVKKGQLLFIIDQRPYQAALNHATASEKEAVANREKATALVEQSRAEREQTRAKLDLAQKRLARSQPLVRSGAISEDEFDVLSSEVRQSEADQFAADAAIESAKASVVAAEAEIATAKADVETAKLDLSYTRITAPISGRISRRYVTKGNYVSGGSIGASLLTTIVSLDPIHCYFDASERALLKYTRMASNGERESSRNAKNPAYLALVDEERFTRIGHMDFVDNQVDRQTGTMRGRAIFSNPNGLLSPGMFGRVRIPGSGRYDAVLIPDSAIGNDQTVKFVYVIDEQKQAVRTPVELGSLSQGLRIIKEGLTGEEQIVLNGLQRVRPNTPLSLVEQEVVAKAENSLPNNYEPVQPENWIRAKDDQTGESATSQRAPSDRQAGSEAKS